MGNKNIITTNFRIQAYDLIMYTGYFCVGFIERKLKDISVLGYTESVTQRYS